MAQPPFALLADVDGPVSNPDAKAIVDDRIIPAIISLLTNGIPVVFNTGRSSDFVQQQVLDRIVEQKPPNLHLLHGICEKGAVWLSYEDDSDVWHFVDENISIPEELKAPVRKLVEEKYSDTMFWDETKETMMSIERGHDTDHETYTVAQKHFVDDVEKLIVSLGHAVTRPGPDARSGAARILIDPSIISVDIESVQVGKDLGAQRAYELLRETLPQQWRTIGDSRVDYDMADWLHENGHSVAHIDVGPQRTKLDKPYPVFIAAAGIHDDAGGAYIQWLADTVAGHNERVEADF